MLGYGNSMLIMQGMKVCLAGSRWHSYLCSFVNVKTFDYIDSVPMYRQKQTSLHLEKSWIVYVQKSSYPASSLSRPHGSCDRHDPDRASISHLTWANMMGLNMIGHKQADLTVIQFVMGALAGAGRSPSGETWIPRP